MTLVLDKDNPLATKVQTRDGRKVRLLAVDIKGQSPIVAAIEISEGNECVANRMIHGFADSTERHRLDIINIPVEQRGWMNIYKTRDGTRTAGDIYPTQQQANDRAQCPTWERIACIEVVFKEGDGLT